METPCLQHLAFIKLAVTFWSNQDLKKFMIKQINGIPPIENALRILKKLAFNLPLSVTMKNRFVDIMERVGYELYVFMFRCPVNEEENDLDLGNDITWTIFGTINEELTYDCYFRRHFNQNILRFKCASLTCSELQIRQVWDTLSESEQKQLNTKTSNLLITYWVYVLEDNIENFILIYGDSIVGFDPFRSVEFNMLTYCLNFNYKSALTYFFEKLPPADKMYLINENNTERNVYSILLRNVLKDAKQENFKYICSFLETANADLATFQLIVNNMTAKNLGELIDHLLRQVNYFGDLHYNIFRLIIKLASTEVKNNIISKLDFYVLNLLAKGRFETFESLLPKEGKTNLYQQISSRFKESKGLSLIYIICKNNQKHLLLELFKYLSKDDNDELFFKEQLSLIQGEYNGFT